MEEQPAKKKRGRPKGSKNKPKKKGTEKKRGKPKKRKAPERTTRAVVVVIPPVVPPPLVDLFPTLLLGKRVQTARKYAVDGKIYKERLIEKRIGSRFVRVAWDDGSNQCHAGCTLEMSEPKTKVKLRQQHGNTNKRTSPRKDH